MRILLIFLVATCFGCLNAQSDFLKMVRISTAKRSNLSCDVLSYSKQLNYNLKDSSFSYRKNTRKCFNILGVEAPRIFLDSKTYTSLDSTFANFSNYQGIPDRYGFSAFRIELIYAIDDQQTKIKSMYVPYDTKYSPRNIIEELIAAYLSILNNAP